MVTLQDIIYLQNNCVSIEISIEGKGAFGFNVGYRIDNNRQLVNFIAEYKHLMSREVVELSTKRNGTLTLVLERDR